MRFHDSLWYGIAIVDAVCLGDGQWVCDSIADGHADADCVDVLLAHVVSVALSDWLGNGHGVRHGLAGAHALAYSERHVLTDADADADGLPLAARHGVGLQILLVYGDGDGDVASGQHE